MKSKPKSHHPAGIGELLGDSELKRIREALQSILDQIEEIGVNEEIAEQVMRDEFTMACEIGGDEANLATWAGIARKALSLNDKSSDGSEPFAAAHG